MKKTTIAIILVILLGTGGYAVYKNINAKAASASSTSQYTEAKASVQNIQQSVSGSGSIQSAETGVIKAANKDTIESVLVSKNQIVTKGQQLITFENGTAAITAPYDGIVSDISVSAGDNVNAAQQLLTMFDNKNLCTTISVDETDLPSLRIGQKADVKVNAYSDEKYTGTIKDISQQGTYSNGVSNFDVIISLDDPKDAKVGMSAEATIVTASKNNVLTVPVEAVKDIKGGKYVMVPNANGSAALQGIQVGISNGSMVEVTNGLVAGEEVELPQVQAPSSNSSKTKGMGGFQMMQGGSRNSNSTGAQGKSNQ